MMLIFLPLIVAVLRPAYQVSADCKFSLNSHLPTKEPLYLTHKGSHLDFVYPSSVKGAAKRDKGSLELSENEEMVLACPGKSNKLARMPENVAESFCVKGTRVSFGAKKTSNIEQVECTTNVKATLEPALKRKCGRTGMQMEIGFEVEQQLLPLISVCHDVKTADTLFVEHEVPATIGGARIFKSRPDFDGGPSFLYKGFNVKMAYTQKHQEKLLNRLLGEGEGDKLIKGTYFLARGHLAPDADFLFATWQWSTYFYVNTAPQWQIINAGHWLALEKYIRKVAEQAKEDLHIITGTVDVLSLTSSTGEKVEIYLEPKEKRLRVPAAFFKIIQSKESNRAIVAVCSNNPFEKVAALCEDVGEEHGWPTTWKDEAKGHIYFCDVEEFLSTTKAMPSIEYTGILSGIGK